MKRLSRSVGSAVNRLLAVLGVRLVRISPPPAFQPNWFSGLKAPPDHPLPRILAQHPSYQRNLADLAKQISRKYPKAGIVDIGANVGDTAALIRSVCDATLICIEPDESFYSYLQENTAAMKDITLARCFLGDVSGNSANGYVPLRRDGTMQLIPSNGHSVATVTFDELRRSSFAAIPIKLIKIDADGFDTRILRGASQCLEREKPALYFEYDPTYLRSTDPRYRETTCGLIDLGYSRVVIFDHLGKLLLWSSDNVIGLLDQLDQYLDGDRLLAYVDICLLSNADADIYETLVGLGNSHPAPAAGKSLKPTSAVT